MIPNKENLEGGNVKIIQKLSVMILILFLKTVLNMTGKNRYRLHSSNAEMVSHHLKTPRLF